MKRARSVLFAATALALLAPAAAGSVGLKDATRPLSARTPEADREIANASVIAAGTITLEVTTHLNATFGKGFAVVCEFDLFAISGSAEVATETAQAYATISGTTATCKVPVPYSWTVASIASTQVEPDFSVTASGPGPALTVHNHSSPLASFVLTGNLNKTISVSATL